eukprot:CAMPEP_0113442824 /NCGR_PEP_ID=MMETSP0014_2-20120614/1815_1 /TAXON_ID=2857 /ORGANISM="Nitzschia sp." /LENGTH=457 /DNA_ID=CAMNT_0000333747 /DNA_START=154 /DNA_END=1523 /DNA_ORIENTATION=- /assembly_acc=CAM_ASM_000159
MTTTTATTTSIPAALIVDHILPFCDRTTYDNLIVANKEICKSVQKLHSKAKTQLLQSPSSSSAPPILPPWPVERTLLVNTNRAKSVSCVSVSTDGLYVAAGCDDGFVYVWDRMNGHKSTLIPTLAGTTLEPATTATTTTTSSSDSDPASTSVHGAAGAGAGAGVLSMTFSPNENGITKLATGSLDGCIRLYNLQPSADEESRPIVYVDTICRQDVGRRRRPEQSRSRPIYSLAFAAFHTQQVEESTSLSSSPSSSWMVSACHDSDVRLWDVTTSKTFYGLMRHPDKVESVAVSPTDPFLVATSTWDGTIRLLKLKFDNVTDINCKVGKPMIKSSRVIGKGLPLTTVQFADDGMYVQGMKGFRLRKWSVMQSSTQKEGDDSGDRDNSHMDVCSDGETILSGRRTNRIHHVAVSRQSHRIAYTEDDGIARISTLSDAHYNATVTKTITLSMNDAPRRST